MTLRVATSGASRRVRALVAALGLIVLVGHVIPRLRQWESSELRDALDTRAKLRQVEALRANLASLSSAANSAGLEPLAPMAYEAVTPVLAAASLAGALRAIAARQSLDLTALSLEGDSAFTAEIAAIRVRASGVGDGKSVLGWLGELEAAVPVARIVELSLVPATPLAHDSVPERIRVEAVVEAVTRRERRIRVAP